jgi:hypothetical protein
MPRPKNPRKARFLAALALAEMTMTQWADQEGVTAGHLSQVLDGKRDSMTLVEKVDRFTDTRLAAAS